MAFKTFRGLALPSPLSVLSLPSSPKELRLWQVQSSQASAKAHSPHERSSVPTWSQADAGWTVHRVEQDLVLPLPVLSQRGGLEEAGLIYTERGL